MVIMKAKNLDTVQETYVKVSLKFNFEPRVICYNFMLQLYLIQNGKRVKKRKTSISRSDDPTNPTWNEPFTFNLQSSYLHNAAIEVIKESYSK